MSGHFICIVKKYMIQATDLKVGTVFVYEDEPFKVMEYKHTHLARGSADVRLKVRGMVSGTIKPLRLSIYFSFLFAFISFFSAIYFVVAKFYLKIVLAEGIAAIIIINLVSFTLIFLFFGILGEYIGKIHLKDENKKSPKIKYKINI